MTSTSGAASRSRATPASAGREPGRSGKIYRVAARSIASRRERAGGPCGPSSRLPWRIQPARRSLAFPCWRISTLGVLPRFDRQPHRGTALREHRSGVDVADAMRRGRRAEWFDLSKHTRLPFSSAPRAEDVHNGLVTTQVQSTCHRGRSRDRRNLRSFGDACAGSAVLNGASRGVLMTAVVRD